MSKDDVLAIFGICDSVAEAQAILRDHLECGSTRRLKRGRNCSAFCQRTDCCGHFTMLDISPDDATRIGSVSPSRTAASHERRKPG